MENVSETLYASFIYGDALNFRSFIRGFRGFSKDHLFLIRKQKWGKPLNIISLD